MSSLLLVATREEDLPFVVETEGHPDNRRFVLVWSTATHRAALDDPDVRHFTVRTGRDDERVGFVILAGLTSPHRSIELRRVVISRKGLGLGRAAVREVKRRAFEELGAHRLWLDVFDWNDRARHLYETEGFREEGVLRECFLGPDGFESLVVMSVLAAEYAAV